MMVFQLQSKAVRKRVFAVLYQYHHKHLHMSCNAADKSTKEMFKRIAQAQRQLINKSRRLRPFAETIEGIREQKNWQALNEWAEREYTKYSSILGPLHMQLTKEQEQLQAVKLVKAREDALTIGNVSIFPPNKAGAKEKTSIKAKTKADGNWNVAQVNTLENGKSRYKNLVIIEDYYGLTAGEIEKACKIRGLEVIRNKNGVMLRKRTIDAIKAYDYRALPVKVRYKAGNIDPETQCLAYK